MIDHTPGTSGYHVEVDSESHNRPAFWCLDGHLLVRTRSKRLNTRVRPGVAGRKVGLARTDLVELELRYEFDGAYELDGSPATDREATLADTLDWFIETFVDPTGPRAVTVTGKGGASWSGDMVVTEFRAADGLEDCAAMLFVSLPDGLLAPVGS